MAKSKAEAFTLNARLTMIDLLLGATPKDPTIFSTYIASQSPDVEATHDEEVASVPTATKEEKGWTGFHLEDGRPFIYDYVLKGFFKDACSMLSRAPGTESSKITAFRKIIDGLVFVRPRKIFLTLSGPLVILERSLRVNTPQGERVCLARSDAAPAGSYLDVKIMSLGGLDREALEEWLDYGANRGLGQWRNGGYGAFEWATIG